MSADYLSVTPGGDIKIPPGACAVQRQEQREMVRLSTQRVRERESGAKKMDESRARDRHDLLSDGSWAGGLV